MEISPLIEKIDALLPQTQCQRCGYPACKPYAEAIANGTADINQCPPGGAAGIHRLAGLLGREYKPLSAEHGVEIPKQIVVIDENTCIGCTLCIKACPVDAIAGASKLMHTVIAALCTGCELCIKSCPVDCIHLVQSAQADELHPEPGCYDMTPDEKADADASRTRYQFHLFRLEREQREREQRLSAKVSAAHKAPNITAEQKKALIAAAIARTKQSTQNSPNE